MLPYTFYKDEKQFRAFFTEQIEIATNFMNMLKLINEYAQAYYTKDFPVAPISTEWMIDQWNAKHCVSSDTTWDTEKYHFYASVSNIGLTNDSANYRVYIHMFNKKGLFLHQGEGLVEFHCTIANPKAIESGDYDKSTMLYDDAIKYLQRIIDESNHMLEHYNVLMGNVNTFAWGLTLMGCAHVSPMRMRDYLSAVSMILQDQINEYEQKYNAE